MAEYIDRTELELDTEWSDYYDGFTSYSQSQIQDMPTADVIERSKIDKAIEEIDNIDLNEYADNSYQLVNKCIEILKRNIGE